MSRIVDIEPLLKKYDGMNEGTEFSPIHFINDLMALEQLLYGQPKQPCEDCISRQQALDCFEQTNTRQGAKYAIETLPSVIPQTVTEFADKCRECGKIQKGLSENCISRESLRQKLQEHHDFFVNAFGGFENMNYIDKARVDEIDNCIAMVVNEPSVTPQIKPSEDCISILNRIMEYTYGMLTAEKYGLQHLIKSMMDEMSGGGEDEVSD